MFPPLQAYGTAGIVQNTWRELEPRAEPRSQAPPSRLPIGETVFKKKRANSRRVVGLDLDPSHIAAAEVHVNGSITVTRGAVAALRARHPA